MDKTLEELVMAYASVKTQLGYVIAERNGLEGLLEQSRRDQKMQQQEIEALRKKLDKAEQYAVKTEAMLAERDMPRDGRANINQYVTKDPGDYQAVKATLDALAASMKPSTLRDDIMCLAVAAGDAEDAENEPLS